MDEYGRQRLPEYLALDDAVYRDLFEASPTPYLILSPDLKIVAVTESYLAATMTKRQEILGRRLFDVFPDNPDDPTATGAENLRRSLESVLKNRERHVMAIQRYDIRNPDTGQFDVRYWSPINTPVVENSGEVSFLIHRVEDVTEFALLKQEKAERDVVAKEYEVRFNEMEVELLLRSQEILDANELIKINERENRQLQAILEAMPDGILVAGKNGDIVMANVQAEAMFGAERSEIVGQSADFLLPGVISAKPNHHREHSTESYVPPTMPADLRINILRKDGSQFPAHVTFSSLERDASDLVIYSVRDVSFLKNAEDAAREAEARYREVLDNMLEGVQILSFDWRYLYLNEALAQFCGQPRKAMTGSTVMEWFPGFEFTEMYAALNECMQTRTPKLAEFEFVYPDGSKRWFEMSIQPVPEGIFIFSLDITERKTAAIRSDELNESLDQKVRQRTLQLEETNKELEAFSYSISHDLRTPLRHIKAYVEMLRESAHGLLSDEAQRHLNVISDASVEMSQLIDDLLAFSKMGRVEFQSSLVDLNLLVAEIVRGFEPELVGRTVHWSTNNLPEVIGDMAMLKVAFGNLIGNAIKYTRQREVATIEVGCYDGENGQVVVFIRDNGAGFDMHYARNLFGVFQRLHSPDLFEGTGIGLAIVRRIVARHGGRTWAEGEVEKGATFYLSLNRQIQGPQSISMANNPGREK